MSRISEQLKASNWDNLLTLGSLQFRSFLVYWSKLTKCLCYQMLKVHSGIEHQVLSGVEAGLGSGFQNTTVTCKTQKMPIFVRHVRSGENCSAGRSRSVDGAPPPPDAQMKESSRAAFPPVYSGFHCPPPTPAYQALLLYHTHQPFTLCWCARVTLS